MILLMTGLCCLAFFLALPVDSSEVNETYMDVVRHAGRMLRAGHSSDLTQDVIGFRALCRNQDAYPVLGPAMEKLGIHRDIHHVSTHPPTAFLLVSPVAWLQIDPGARLWAWMMVACLAGSFLCLGCSVVASIGLSLICLAWPPVAMCLGQLTVIWLLGVSGAYKFLSQRPALSGALLSLAAATKMAPALLLALMLKRRRALLSFIAIQVVLLVTLIAVSRRSITRYIQIVEHTVPQQSGRPDNGSFVGRMHHQFGRSGLLVAMGFLAMVLFANWRHLFAGDLTGWAALSYFAVACLPILWTYSLVPLLFLGRWAWLCGRLPLLFFTTFILVTTVLPIWNEPRMLAATVLLLGFGLIVTGWSSTLVPVHPPTTRVTLLA